MLRHGCEGFTVVNKIINNNTLLKELYPYFRYLKEYDKTSFPDVMYLDELFEKNSYKKI